MILGISMIAVAEAFSLGEKLGLDPHVLFQISSKASGSCWAMLNHNPVPGIVETSAANRDYRRSEEHTSELQSLMRNSYAVFCLKKKKSHAKKQDQTHKA